MEHHHDNTTLFGTVSGTALSVVHIEGAEFWNTVVLAGLGACVSFVVSLILKWIWEKLK